MLQQHGISWYFKGETVYGQFVNGDYWVIGPVEIIYIDPPSVTVNGRTVNGSMINPVPSYLQGYDSTAAGTTYNSSLNAALGISDSTPLILPAGSSLISSISADDDSGMPNLTDAAILTVLSTAPPAGSFRPPYAGTDKTIRYNESQLNYTLLARRDPVADTPGLSVVEQLFERPWIDHFEGYGGEDTHPSNNMQHYGRGIAGDVSVGALALHLNYTDEEKRTLLIRYVQLGIDNFGIVQSGGRTTWTGQGGHNQGRKWPILFAGLILNDTNMQNIGQKSGDYLYTYNYPEYGPGNEPPDYIHFEEDDQSFYVTQEDVDRTNSTLWNPDSRNVGTGPDDPADNAERYAADDIGMPEWGIEHALVPYGDNRHWGAMYRFGSGSVWGGFILAARIMNARTLWNHDAIFDYQDRYMAVMADSADTPDWRSAYETKWNSNTWQGIGLWNAFPRTGDEPRQLSAFVENMWDEYRDNY